MYKIEGLAKKYKVGCLTPMPAVGGTSLDLKEWQ